MLRRLKIDVMADLPKKIEKIVRVDMTKSQISIYKLILKKNA